MYQKPQFWKLQLCPLCTYFQAASRKHGRSHSSKLKMNLKEAWPFCISLLWLNPSHTVPGNYVTSSFKTSSTASSSSFFELTVLLHILLKKQRRLKSIFQRSHYQIHLSSTPLQFAREAHGEHQCPGPSA